MTSSIVDHVIEKNEEDTIPIKHNLTNGKIQHLRNTVDNYSSTTTANSSSSPTSCITKYSKQQTCQHIKIIKNVNHDNCASCGISIPRDGSRNFKSKSMNYVNVFSIQKILESMINKYYTFNKEKNSEYMQLRPAYVDWIFELAEKLKISMNTSHLAVHLLDILLFKNIKYNSQLQLFAPVALLVAAKTIELDERIPFISKLRRVANPIFSVEEFRKAELNLLEAVEWNPIFTTNIELLEYYLTQGIINSNDEIEINININDYFSNASQTSSGNPSHNDNHDNNMQSQFTNINDNKNFAYPINKILKEKNIHLIDTKENPVNNNIPKFMPEIELNVKSTTIYNSKENNENIYGSTGYNNNSFCGTSLNGNNTNVNSKTNTPVSKSYSALSPINEFGKDIENDKMAQKNVLKKKANFEDINLEKKKERRTEKINEDKVIDILSKIEKDIPKLATYIIKDDDFLCYEPSILAASSIAFLRRFYKFINPWNNELEAISSLKYEALAPCLNMIIKKFENNFQLSSITKPPRINKGTTSSGMQSTIKQDNNICTELKLFNKAAPNNKMACENGNNESLSKINLYPCHYPSKNTENAINYELLLREKDRERERNKIFNFHPKSTVNNGVLNGEASGYIFHDDILNKKSHTSTHAHEIKSERESKYHNSGSIIIPSLTKYGTTIDHSHGHASILSNTLLEARSSCTTATSYHHSNTILGHNIGNNTAAYIPHISQGRIYANDAYLKNNEPIISSKIPGLLSARNITSKITCGLYGKKP